MSELVDQQKNDSSQDPQSSEPATEEKDEAAASSNKETFQWNTPADEFAEDVASDVEEESEDEGNRDGDISKDSNGTSHCSEIVNGLIDVKPRLLQDGNPGKKVKAKNQFPCPKCNKVWNWPWELRRHLVMHFKEVS